MNLFEIVKYGVSCREAAEQYGVEVNHYGMALCPFHNDRHPSLYVADDHYGDKYDSLMMRDSKQDVADLLDEHEEKKSIQEFLRKQQKPQTQRQRKAKRHEQER